MADDWIPWHGGERPSHLFPTQRVLVKLRNDRIMGPKQAQRVDWKHREFVPEYDTVAYRLAPNAS